jgi:DNA-binding response OmpR family regulator
MNAVSNRNKVLIVEDDPVVARLYRGQLEDRGYEVDIATDGQAGFARLYNLKPDLVLLDLMLPRMNGVDLLKKIRAQKDFKNLPIVVLTNAYVPLMVRDAYDAGATAVHNKSAFGNHEMLDVLRECLPPTASQPGGNGQVPGGSLAEAQARDAFFVQAPADQATLRGLLRQISQSPDEVALGQHLGGLYREVHALTGKAALVGLQPIAQMASALEALLRELLDKPETVTPLTLRTVVAAVDFLQELSTPDAGNSLVEGAPLEVLVVEDDSLSRRALALALEKSLLKTECVDTSAKAMDLVAKRVFDAIFLDVGMPDTDGFTLCQHIRASGPNQNTPVVFVTNHTDFKDRVQSTLSGANDFVAKPFLFIEITVKALVFCLRHRLQQRRN